MRFWGVSPLRYIKSEEISPVKQMTANEWGSQPAHSARSGSSVMITKEGTALFWGIAQWSSARYHRLQSNPSVKRRSPTASAYFKR